MEPSGTLKARQIKAGRALLDWSQENLAEATSLSIATIRKLEAGNISPRGKTQNSLRSAFENAGLEFLDPDGVRHRPEEIKIFQGPEGVRAFYDDVYHSLSKDGGELATVVTDPKTFWGAMGDYAEFHRKRMEAIKHKITARCLLSENPSFLPATSYCEYRIISKSYINSVPFYVYKDKCAIRTIKADPAPKIVVVQSLSVADSFRFQFDSMWEKGTPLNELDKFESLHDKKRGGR